jgi:hypothetical protein
MRIHRLHVFFALPDPVPLVRAMNPDNSYYLATLFVCFSFKNDVNVCSKSNKEKNGNKILVFAGILKVNDEHRRIRIEDARIRIH